MKKLSDSLFSMTTISLLSLGLLVQTASAEDAPAAAAAQAPAAEAPAPAEAAAPAPALSPMQQADAIYDESSLAKMQKAKPMYLKLAKEQPNNYEAQWKAARVLREIADYGKKHHRNGWKATCKKLGKQCMGLAEKAFTLNPKKVEGHFYYGLCVGNYADGVSIVTAVSEGLAGKTKKGFNNAYKINKHYNGDGPIKALGRYWTVLPWPLRDRNLGIKYLREYYNRHKNDAEGRVYLAEALLGRDDGNDKAEAKKLLSPVRNSNNAFYKNYANRLWKDEDLD